MISTKAATASSRISQRFSPTAYDQTRHQKKKSPFSIWQLSVVSDTPLLPSRNRKPKCFHPTISCKFERGCYDRWETHRLSGVHAKRAYQHTAGQGKIGSIDNTKTTNRDSVGGNGFLLTQLVVMWSCYKSGHGPVGAAAAAALSPVDALRLSRSGQNFFFFTDSHPLLSPVTLTLSSHPFLFEQIANILTVSRCVGPRINPSYYSQKDQENKTQERTTILPSAAAQ